MSTPDDSEIERAIVSAVEAGVEAEVGLITEAVRTRLGQHGGDGSGNPKLRKRRVGARLRSLQNRGVLPMDSPVKERPDLWSVERLGRFLGGKGTSAIYTDIHRGVIPARCVVKVGRRTLFDPLAVYAWIDGLSEDK